MINIQNNGETNKKKIANRQYLPINFILIPFGFYVVKILTKDFSLSIAY